MSEWASNWSVPLVQIDDLVPAEERRLRLVPAELRPPVDDAAHEDRRHGPSLGENRQRLLSHVEEPSSKLSPTVRGGGRPSSSSSAAWTTSMTRYPRCEVVHLPPEAAWADRQLVASSETRW